MWDLQLKEAADDIPKNDQNYDQRDIGNQNSACNGDRDNTDIPQDDDQDTQQCGCQHCLGDLLSDHIRKEEGVKTANDGIHSGKQRTNKDLQNAGKQQ